MISLPVEQRRGRHSKAATATATATVCWCSVTIRICVVTVSMSRDILPSDSLRNSCHSCTVGIMTDSGAHTASCLGSLSQGVKRQGCGAGHSPPTSPKTKKMRIYKSTPPCLQGNAYFTFAFLPHNTELQILPGMEAVTQTCTASSRYCLSVEQ